jgi:hypothetical protein
MKPKKIDSTIDAIHQIRSEISDRFGGDVFAIAEDAARRQAASHRPVWKPKYDEQSVVPESPATAVPDGPSNPATG